MIKPKWMVLEICPLCGGNIYVHYNKRGVIDRAFCRDNECSFCYPSKK